MIYGLHLKIFFLYSECLYFFQKQQISPTIFFFCSDPFTFGRIQKMCERAHIDCLNLVTIIHSAGTMSS